MHKNILRCIQLFIISNVSEYKEKAISAEERLTLNCDARQRHDGQERGNP